MTKKTAARKQQLPLVAPITTVELMALETYRDTLKLLSQRVAETRKALEGTEEAIIMRLKAGAQTEGPYTAVIQQVQGDCRPAWKEVHLQHMEKVHGQPQALTEALVRKDTVRSVKEVLVVGKAT